MNKKTISSLFVLLILIASYFSRSSPEQIVKTKASALKRELNTSTDSARVLRVVDGDTIVLENKQKVRYIGIDTPELHDPRRPVQCFGQEAYEENKSLVEGKIVTLEKDVSNTDKYGRLLRYVYLPQDSKQTTSSGFMVNDYLARQGYAHSSSYPPDIKHQDEFKNAQREAQENNRGLWSSCK